MLPIAVVRALRLTAAHPAVSAVRVTAQTAAGVVAEVDIVTELCAAWRMGGQSPSGVKAREVVTFQFPPSYPSDAPRISLRSDFDRAHPHINPLLSDALPEPCIVAGSPRELLQTRGFEGLLDQLVDWLDKAAMLDLNNPKNGWEPVRRDSIDDYVLIDGANVRALATPAGGCAIITTYYWCLKCGTEQVFAVHHPAGPTITLAAARLSRQQKKDSDSHQGVSVGLVLWAKDISPSQPFIVAKYVPETVVTIGDLLKRAELFGCRQELDAKLSHIAVGLDGKLTAPIAVTFLVRRPYDVIGTGSPIELCSYLVEIKSTDDVVKQTAKVRLCSLREQLSLALLRSASGVRRDATRKRWTLLGCGSVGSKIAIHLARRGAGPTRIVDRSRMAPHNFGRHSLIPTTVDDPVSVPLKVSLLATDLGHLLQEPEQDSGDILTHLETEEGRRKIAPEADTTLLNTTASTVVREQLTARAWGNRPRICEAHLLGAGRVAYAAFEGPDGNPSVSDLAAESYLAISKDKRISRVVFSAEAEAVSIGQGCSAITFPMPDSRLSTLAAGLAEVFAQRLDAPTHAGGEYVIGYLAEDGLSQAWSRAGVAPWKTISADSGVVVRISSAVDQAIRSEIAKRPGSETGGVIVGRFSQIGNCFQVVDLIPAPPDSSFSAERFTLGTSGLQKAIRDLLSSSNGTLYALGTWHNHLVKSGPSLLDAATAAKLSLRQFFPVLMLIALPDGYTCLTAEPATVSTSSSLIVCSTAGGDSNNDIQ